MTEPRLDVESVRSAFPALARTDNGRPVAYLDGPGGTQVPQRVIDAMSRVMSQGLSNLGRGLPQLSSCRGDHRGR